MKEMEFPLFVSDDYVCFEGGMFERLQGNQYKRIEAYLPASPKTYGFTTFEECFNRLVYKLQNGLLAGRRSNKHVYTWDENTMIKDS